jgi:phage terminase large subunit GpA-like protein
MTLSAQLDRSLRDVFAPVDTREVWQWAEDEIVLTRRQTETPGPYSTLLTPYIREPLECFSDARVTDLALCFGTQTSKTTCVMIGAAWRMCNNPFPTLWVMPTESMARSFSENRWQPMVQDCRPLNVLKPYNTNRFKALEQQFRDATLTFVGSNSPSSLASRPAGLLIMDETDKFAEATHKESSAVALAENRTKSYTNALRVKTSTPTVPDGEIWSAFHGW